MAVATDEFAFGDLRQDGLAPSAPQIADFVDLLSPGQMIPGHRRVMKETPAVSAGHALFQIVMPPNYLSPSLALPRH